MKKKEIPATPANTRERMSNEAANDVALGVMGSHFTLAVVSKPANAKIKAFRDDAESCLKTLRARNKAKIVMSLWVVVALALLATVIQRCYNLGWNVVFEWLTPTLSIVALVTGFIAFLYGSANLSVAGRPGNTAKMIAKEWRPWRNKALKAGIVSELASNISWKHRSADVNSPLWRAIQYWNYDSAELEGVLDSTLSAMAYKAASDHRVAECKGYNKTQKRLRSQFALIDKIGQQLGYERLEWDKYLNGSL